MRVSKGSVYPSLLTLLLLSTEASALPIGFQTNQGSLEYSETTSDHFNVYHDKRVPEEGAATLNALEAARPYLESWFQQQRKRPLPVVMSAVTENASFANFIFDAIELQSLGLSTKELAWHEYTHSTMYRTMDNFLGPAGNILHLPWMPAWFLEGLAESTSVSVGSDWTAGIERYHALSGNWPSFARLHSLYSKTGDFDEGYPTSGAFASYVLRTGDANKLPQMLDDFFDYTKPWWWPWSMVPFNGFLPFDATMERFVGMNTEDLYEKYKKDAKAHWEGVSSDPFLVGDKAKRKTFRGLASMRSSVKTLHIPALIDGDLWDSEVQFDAKTGWATGTKKTKLITDEYEKGGRSHLYQGDYKQLLDHDKDGPEHVSTLTYSKPKTKSRIFKRKSYITDYWETPTTFGWSELQQSNVRVCQAPKAGGPVVCPVVTRTPRWLDVIGDRSLQASSKGMIDELWLTESEEKLPGNVFKVRRYDPEAKAMRPDFLTVPARPLKVAFAGKDIWILFAEHTQRTVRRFDESGKCLGMVTLKDHITHIAGLADGSLVLGLYGGDDSYLYKYAPGKAPEKACTGYTGQMSPLQYAILKGGNVDFKTAVQGASIWNKEEPLPAAEEQKIATAVASDRDLQPNTGSSGKSRPAAWRGRPAFAFPWIGADDALGPQFGIVTVPLIDQLQNESVRATLLYGPASHFPYQEVALVSTRFRPTLTLTGYRQQTYNGRFQKKETGDIVSSYLDEKGGRFEGDVDFRFLGGSGNFGLGIKYAHLKPYIGPEFNGHGFLAEPASSLTYAHAFGRFVWSGGLSGRAAPEQWNDEFDYNQLGGSTTVGVDLPLSSKASAGVEGSRTRGKKRRDVMELYRPLKTYVPGSGGGYNQNSFPLGDADTGLFAPAFGDTQARAKANWTVPLIKDLERMVWILYLERLDFTAFYNYGGAWYGNEPTRGWDKLTRAHGYNIDLQLENKGVRFNVGLGVGQVIGNPFEPYVTTGFDALF